MYIVFFMLTVALGISGSWAISLRDTETEGEEFETETVEYEIEEI